MLVVMMRMVMIQNGGSVCQLLLGFCQGSERGNAVCFSRNFFLGGGGSPETVPRQAGSTRKTILSLGIFWHFFTSVFL